jgi:Ion channel
LAHASQETAVPAANTAGVKRARQRYGVLLIALCATFFFYGVAGPGDLQRAIGTALVGTTLLLALHAADVTAPRLRIACVAVAVIVTAVIVASVASQDAVVEGLAAIANGLLIAIAPPAVVIGVYRNLRTTGTVTVTVVAGVLCLYLLLGLFFSFVYLAIQNLGGAPFFANGDAAVPSRSVYFSFVTLATLGYGDYTARTNLGHTLSITEALLGQIYLVTVVAAIVGRLVPRGPQVS